MVKILHKRKKPLRCVSKRLLVEIVAPLFAINLQIHTNQKFHKPLIHKLICKTPFANHCIALQKCGYNVGTFADIMYLCIDEKFEHYGSFICT